jgi:pentatricopeptide repeat protein
MSEYQVAPTATTFNHIVQRYVTDENLEVALQYFYAMKSRGITPDLRSAQAVVILAAQQGYPRLAIDLARWFEEISVRRLDHAAWMNVLIASANSLYVSLYVPLIYASLIISLILKG